MGNIFGKINFSTKKIFLMMDPSILSQAPTISVFTPTIFAILRELIFFSNRLMSYRPALRRRVPALPVWWSRPAPDIALNKCRTSSQDRMLYPVIIMIQSIVYSNINEWNLENIETCFLSCNFSYLLSNNK